MSIKKIDENDIELRPTSPEETDELEYDIHEVTYDDMLKAVIETWRRASTFHDVHSIFDTFTGKIRLAYDKPMHRYNEIVLYSVTKDEVSGISNLDEYIEKTLNNVSDMADKAYSDYLNYIED